MSNNRKEQGSVMVLALLVTLIILGVGLTVMWVSSSGMKVSGNITRRQEALYAAEAGIERARAILTANPNWSGFLAGCPTPEDNTDKGNILCTPASVKLQNVQTIDSSTTTHTQTAGALQNATYTIWIRNDWQEECDTPESSASKVDCDGDGDTSSGDMTAAMTTDNNRRVIVRSEGLGRDGLSYVAVEVVLTGAGAVAGSGDYNQIGFNAQGTHSASARIDN